MKKMKIYFYGEIYNIRNSYDIYHTRRKQRAEKKRFMNTTTKQKNTNLYKKNKKKIRNRIIYRIIIRVYNFIYIIYYIIYIYIRVREHFIYIYEYTKYIILFKLEIYYF